MKAQGVSWPTVAHPTGETTALETRGPMNGPDPTYNTLTRSDGRPVPELGGQGDRGKAVTEGVLSTTQAPRFAEPKSIALTLGTVDSPIAVIVQAIANLNGGLGWDADRLAAV